MRPKNCLLYCFVFCSYNTAYTLTQGCSMTPQVLEDPLIPDTLHSTDEYYTVDAETAGMNKSCRYAGCRLFQLIKCFHYSFV